MVTELIRPVKYNSGISQKLINLEISSCRCSQLECNEESAKTEGYSALHTLLLPLSYHSNKEHKLEFKTHYSFMQVKGIAESILQYL